MKHPLLIKSGNQRAFTLIELIVTVTILLILAALLMPALNLARSKVNETLCAQGLANIGKAVSLYIADHDQSLPGPLNPAFGGWYSASTASGLVTSFLYPYMGLTIGSKNFSAKFVCPSWQSTLGSKASDPNNWVSNSYVLQKQIIVDGKPQYPASMPWGTLHSNNANGTYSETPMKLMAIWQPAANWMITDLDTQGNFGASASVATPIHKTFRNTLYFDFHVEKVPVSATP